MLLFATGIFLSVFLLFQIQPMIGKLPAPLNILPPAWKIIGVGQEVCPLG